MVTHSVNFVVETFNGKTWYHRIDVDEYWRFDAPAELDHGHLYLACEDGMARIRFPCQSQAGVRRILEEVKERCPNALLAGTVEFVTQLPPILLLPETMTEEEERLFADPAQMQVLTHFFFAS
jgi:predicted nucleotide-binding protein (sugar kinase/HSP70/actin superfamily)